MSHYYHYIRCSLLMLMIKCAYSALKSDYNSEAVIDAVKCLRQITDRQFKFDPYGFMVITKTFNLSQRADDVLSEYFKIVYQYRSTTVMVIGNDQKDIHWRKDGSNVTAQNDEHTDSDDLGVTFNEDVFIQSHLLFIRLSDFYVIIVDSYRMFNSKIRQLVRVPSWNAKAKMIIYISAITKSQRNMMMYPMHILRSLWSYHVMNVALLVHDWKNRSVINIFSWNPYDPPKRCGEKNQDTKYLAELYDKCISGSLTDEVNLFPEKVPKNLMKCNVSVLGVIWHPFLNHNKSDTYAGFDRRILDIIAERMNFSIILNTTEPKWGDRYENGSWDGMLGNLKKGYGEVAIGAIYPNTDVHEDFDATLSYLQDSFAWVVPRAREIPEWEKLIIILKPNMWLATGVVYFMCTLIWYGLAKVQWETGIKLKGYTPSVLDSWCINLGVSTVFRPNSDSFRVYFLFFCLYSMIWCTIYQTKLITILTNPTYEKQVKETDEILDSKIKFGGNIYFRELFNNSIDEKEDYFFDNYLEMNVHNVLDHVIKYRNLTVLTSRLYVRHLSATTSRYNDAHGIPLFYTIESNVFSFPIEIIVVKGFAFLDRFNFLLSLFKSSGLIQRLFMRFDEATKRMTAELVRESNEYDDDNVLKLTLVHLQGAFMALLLGTITATMVFIGEAVVYRRIKAGEKSGKKRHKKKWTEIKKNVKEKGYGVRVKKHLNFHPHSDFLKTSHWLDKQKNF